MISSVDPRRNPVPDRICWRNPNPFLAVVSGPRKEITACWLRDGRKRRQHVDFWESRCWVLDVAAGRTGCGSRREPGSAERVAGDCEVAGVAGRDVQPPKALLLQTMPNGNSMLWNSARLHNPACVDKEKRKRSRERGKWFWSPVSAFEVKNRWSFTTKVQQGNNQTPHSIVFLQKAQTYLS